MAQLRGAIDRPSRRFAGSAGPYGLPSNTGDALRPRSIGCISRIVAMTAWRNLWSEKVLDEWLVPVCKTADDLRRYPLVHSVSEPWTAWLFDGRAVKFARSYWLVCPTRAQDLPGVKTFMDWVRAEAKLFTTTRIP